MEIKPTAALQVVGHRWAIELLSRQIERDHIPQALLIAGPQHVGKSTLARYLAQRLNCQGADRPCGYCVSCRKIVSGNHPDVRIFDQDDEPIKIEQVRELQRELALSPHESPFRVVLLCNFERATTSAANALLKTLEEPAGPAVLILTATDPGKLLPTIVSRCQLLTLRPLPQPEILAALQARWHASPPQAELLAQLAAGRLGWAVRALTDDDFLARREQRWQELLNLLGQSRAERLAYAHQLSRDLNAIKELLALWLTIWRDLLLVQNSSQARLINLDWQQSLARLAGQVQLNQTIATLTSLRRALKNLEHNVNPRLNLELVLLRLPVC